MTELRSMSPSCQVETMAPIVLNAMKWKKEEGRKENTDTNPKFWPIFGEQEGLTLSMEQRNGFWNRNNF